MDLPLQFSWGTTRFVVLVGPIAIKIARIRPLRMVQRFIKHQINGEVKAKMCHFSENPFIAAVKYVFAGPFVNWSEYRLYQSSLEPFFVPTNWSFGGMVNIQRRGTAVTQEELDAHHPFGKMALEEMPEVMRKDMTRADNFCWYDGHLCLIDYGGKEVFTYFWRPKLKRDVVAT